MARHAYAAHRPAWAALALLARLGLGAALGGTLGACVSAPTTGELLAVGYRSPEQAFATFQTALRADLVDLEYRSLSSGFKRTNGVSQLVYETARERLFREQPLMRLAAGAKVVDRQDVAADRVRLTARVEALFQERAFHVHLVREEFQETHDARGLLQDGYVTWSDVVREVDGQLELRVPLPEGSRADQITLLCAGREWKIDGFEPAPASPTNP